MRSSSLIGLSDKQITLIKKLEFYNRVYLVEMTNR